MKKRKIIIIIVLCLIVLFSTYFGYKLILTDDPLPFSEFGWNHFTHIRYRMFDSFLEQHQVRGLTRNELYDLLGTNGMVDENTYVIQSAYVDFKTIIFYFDENNLVSFFMFSEIR